MTGYVRLSQISRRFGHTVAVDDVSLDLQQGEFLALLGPSGCGKTTLLRILAGFEYPDAGEVELDGRILNGPRTFVPPERRKIGMVFQDFALFPHMDVGRNVAFGLPRGTSTRRVEELLELVGLAGLGGRMPHQLSGGQQQRVALARTHAAEPALVLLDEPFSNLDPAMRARVRTEVKQIIQSLGTTAIFVTHDQEEALGVAESIAVMLAGRVAQRGLPKSIYEQPATRAVAEFLGDANILEGEVRDGAVSFALGIASASGEASGPVHVLIRPEHLSLSAEGGVSGIIVGREYYGHDQMIAARLADGTQIRVRSQAAEDVSVGQHVGIVLRGNITLLRD